MGKENKEIILKDILASHGFTSKELESYVLCNKDNIYWFYTSLVIREENESLISAWSYIISDSKDILSSQVYIQGEGKLASTLLKPYIFKEENKKHYTKIELLLEKNKKMFPDKIFGEGLSKILEKYKVEIIIQKENYRVRIRPLLIEDISYDLFYNSPLDKLSFNLFAPEL